MLGLRIFVNGKFIVTYAADGIIVSSPTGSTAYSLSAGGPVVHPDVGVFIITPICPHTLNARSLVIPDKENVRIVGDCDEGQSQMMLTVDGQLGEHMLSNDEVGDSKSGLYGQARSDRTSEFLHQAADQNALGGASERAQERFRPLESELEHRRAMYRIRRVVFLPRALGRGGIFSKLNTSINHLCLRNYTYKTSL